MATINPFDREEITAQLSQGEVAILKAIGAKSILNDLGPINALAKEKSDGTKDIDGVYDEAIKISIKVHTFHTKRMLTTDITKCRAEDAKIIQQFRDSKEGKALKEMTDAELNKNALNSIFLDHFRVEREPGAPQVDLDMLRACLRNGVDVNYSDSTDPGMTALFWTIVSNDKRCFDFLLQQKADCSTKTRFGDFPLMKAAQDGRKEMVIALLANGADPNQKRGVAWTADHYTKDPEIRDLIMKAQKTKTELKQEQKVEEEQGTIRVRVKP